MRSTEFNIQPFSTPHIADKARSIKGFPTIDGSHFLTSNPAINIVSKKVSKM